MATLPETTRRALRILDAMSSTRELSGRAVSRLRRAMLAGEDVYPYYSADGRAYVWADNRRFTAPEYEARAYRMELAPAVPVVLWCVGASRWTDEDGRIWQIFQTPDADAPRTCDVCAAKIRAGYAAPEALYTLARWVCVAHVAAHPGEGVGETHTPSQCPTCEGTGEVSEWVPYGMGNVAMPVPCDCACHGEPDGE